LIEEIEAKIQETIDADEDEQQVVRKAHASQGAKAPTKNKCNNFIRILVSVFIISNCVFPSAKRKQQAKDSLEDEVSMDEDEPEMPGHPAHLENATPHSRTPRKKPSSKQGRSTHKKIVINQSSSEDESSVEEEDDDESEKEAQPAAKSKKNIESSRSTRRMQSESDQEDFIKPTSRGISLSKLILLLA
jgi:hypothetical protein